MSILGGGDFRFPSRRPLTKRLKDVLESEVDEKYYLSDEQVSGLIASNYDQNKRFYDISGLSPTLSTMGGGNRQPKIVDDIYKNRPARVYNKAPTLRANHAGDLKVIEPFAVPIKTANTNGYDLATDGDGIDLNYPDSKTRRGRVGHSVSKTIPTSGGSQGVLDGLRIRKLTPKECWRLMGFNDEDFERAAKVCSNTQLYKQAGNSIVVPVLEGILKELLWVKNE